MSKKVVIIDYGLGNLYSISQACSHLGFYPEVSADREKILKADSLILPGVGAFKVAMEHLISRKLVDVITEFANSERPLMGVCLGMQLLFEQSEEFGVHKGLGLIKGAIKKIPELYHSEKLRIPHIGWNRLFKESNDWKNTPLEDISEEDFMYFVHSYYASPDNPEDILSSTLYENFKYCSSVQKNNIFGFQFHPEKSGEKGLSIYKNFLNR
jgi:glutamine amidotransferase